MPLVEFLHPLLRDGRVILHDRPEPRLAPAEQTAAAAVLHQAHAAYQPHVAGPPLDFDAPAALAAAALVKHACWFLVSRDEPDADLEERLRMPAAPRTPTQHLSADLTLRFLHQVHRRAHALDPADRLTLLLADVLRRWPLSGVLSDVAEPPLTPLDFGGHHGLLLLYAERLARADKPAWLPDGPGRGYVELVWHDLGRELPAAAATEGEDAHG